MLLICLLLCFAAPCGAEEEMPELRIGVTIYAPFYYRDASGQFTGIDEEMAREACVESGYLRWRVARWIASGTRFR